MDRAPIEIFINVLDLLSKKSEWRATALDVFSGRLARIKDLKVEDMKLVEIADRLISDTSLIYERHTSEYDWTLVAKWYLPHDPVKVAQILIDAHLGDDGDGVTWFLQHSQASKTFQEALRSKTREIWRLIAKRLEGDDAFRFTVGFPQGLIEVIPDEIVLDWAAADPKKRVRHLLQIISIEPEKEDSLGMKLLARFGKANGLNSSFVGSYIKGSWSGETSDYFSCLAKRLDEALPLAKNSAIRQWLNDTSSSLKANAKEEREREDERRLLNGF